MPEEPLCKYLIQSDITLLYTHILKRRDRLIIRLPLHNGVSADEIARIHIEDIHFNEQTLDVRDTQNSVVRTIDLDTDTLLDINDYLMTINKHLGHDRGLLFNITRRQVERICSFYGRKANLTKKVTPMLLIDTFTRNAVVNKKPACWIKNQRGLKTLYPLSKFL